MNITIQKATPGDNPDFREVVRIRGECWKEFLTKHMVGPENAPPINVQNGVFFLIKDGDKSIGIHLYYGITSEYYQCFFFYLIPEYRNKGVYSITYQLVVDEFKKLGAKRLSTLVNLTELEMTETFKNLDIEPVSTSNRYDYSI